MAIFAVIRVITSFPTPSSVGIGPIFKSKPQLESYLLFLELQSAQSVLGQSTVIIFYLAGIIKH